MSIVDRISSELSLDAEYISRIATNSKKYYSTYNIPKRSGGTRRIYHPSPSLKVIQYWLNYNVFNLFPVSIYSTAYSKGSSIKKNAEIHKCSNHILHIDLINFFESINETHLDDLFTVNHNLLSNNGFTSEDLAFIKKVCLYERHLVIGSVCSPIVSNCVMYEIDMQIGELLRKYGDVKYSRYADDLVFSSKYYLSEKLIPDLATLLLPKGFHINQKKTRFMSGKTRKMVTGLITNSNKISIGKSRHLLIKKMLYQKLVKNIGNGKVILGHLFFLKDIEPDYFNRIMLKYSKYGDVLKILKEDANGSTPPPDSTTLATSEAAPTLDII